MIVTQSKNQNAQVTTAMRSQRLHVIMKKWKTHLRDPESLQHNRKERPSGTRHIKINKYQDPKNFIE